MLSLANDVPAVVASVRVLEMLAAESPSAVSPSHIVRTLDLNRSTCYNILGTLEGLGWAAKLGGRAGWTLGPRFLSLTGANSTLTADVVQDVLDQLSRDLGVVVCAVERDSGGFVVTAKADRRTGVRVTVGIGDRFQFSAPAVMQAFEAWTPADQFERKVREQPLVEFTDYTITDLAQLHGLLAEVRAKGYSSSIRQYDLAQGAVASPIFDGAGEVHLVLLALAFSSELNEDTVDRYGVALREGADRVMRRIGSIRPVDAGAHAAAGDVDVRAHAISARAEPAPRSLGRQSSAT